MFSSWRNGSTPSWPMTPWTNWPSREQHPLPPRLVEQNAGGHGGIQRFHAHGGDGNTGGSRAPLRADAMGLVTDDQGAAAGKIRARERLCGGAAPVLTIIV